MELWMDSKLGRPRLIEGTAVPPEDWPVQTSTSHYIDELYRNEAPSLARYIRWRAHQDDALDYVQDSFKRLLGIVERTGFLPDTPRAYLSTIAGNLLRDRARTKGRQPLMSPDHVEDHQIAGPDPHGQLEARDMLRRAENAIAGMKPKTREVFLLHRIEGLDYNEIGERMGLSVKGVENQMSSALKLIRRRVGPR
jgi:RNA polymerase sigma factor (sigma-70 family)